MRAALVLLAACWTGPVERAPEVPIARSGRCEIHDAAVSIAGFAKLSVGGKAFARQPGPFTRFDVVFRDDTARVRTEDDMFVLDGELDLEDTSVRPREVELHDGWVEIRAATARRATADTLRIEVELPAGLDPHAVPFTLPCRGLTFATPPEAPELDDLDVVALPLGTALRPKPDGPVVARVIGTSDPDDPDTTPNDLEAKVLERRGGMTQIRLAGTNPVVAWASSRALHAQGLVGLGGFGYGRTGIGRSTVSCRQDTAIYVRVADRVVRVGHVKRDIGFYLIGSDDGPEVEVDLGLAKPAARPYITRADFEAACD